MTFRALSLLTTGLLAVTSGSAWAADPVTTTSRVRLGTGTDDATGPELTLPSIDVVSQRLDQARSQIQPNLGATRYEY